MAGLLQHYHKVNDGLGLRSVSGVEVLYRSGSITTTYDEHVAPGARNPSLPWPCAEHSERRNLLARRTLRWHCQRPVGDSLVPALRSLIVFPADIDSIGILSGPLQTAA